ncbi:hypothetical protein M501DRAFT_996415 [Patellaria atrata CBS 101060]|uniref:Mediator of RNA polymerase II transcription subunit 22 n=1 Tax=Patellaria atrata CBS 101060 TaxID=1346257 RepID=A0A9P4S698_9PEZI|nr:hypothetical protein M501DRAFT_996415 [Patellaria atrata CBS 101060]
MDPSLKNGDALRTRIDKLTQALVQRFEEIVALGAVEKTDLTSSAHNALQMEVETAGLVRVAEDILALTRQMQELWLFGQLNTLGKSATEEKTAEDVRAVARLVEGLVGELGKRG